MKNPKSLSVSDVMLKLGSFPVIGERVIFKDALEEMGKCSLGISCITNSSNQLLGVLTDGDIRRRLLHIQKPLSQLFVDDALTHAIHSPVTVRPIVSLSNAVRLMEDKKVWDLPVTDSNNQLVGLLHLHPAIEALLN